MYVSLKALLSKCSKIEIQMFNHCISDSEVMKVKFVHTINKFASAYACRHSSVREIALMILMAYLSYMLAEVSE